MAHPPANESDITLKSFLTQIWEFNGNSTTEKQKGVKLDFKSTDVFQNSLPILNEMWNTKYDVWINAGRLFNYFLAHFNFGDYWLFF